MNYLRQINGFYNYTEHIKTVSERAQLLYYKLLGHANETDWEEWFQVPTLNLMGSISVSSKKFFYKLRDELIDLGLIEVIKGKRGTNPQYKITELTSAGKFLKPKLSVSQKSNNGTNSGSNSGIEELGNFETPNKQGLGNLQTTNKEELGVLETTNLELGNLQTTNKELGVSNTTNQEELGNLKTPNQEIEDRLMDRLGDRLMDRLVVLGTTNSEGENELPSLDINNIYINKTKLNKTKLNKDIEPKGPIQKSLDTKDPNPVSEVNTKELTEFWNNHKGNMPKILNIKGNRLNHVKARIREYSEDQLREVILKAEASDFMNGKNDRGWIASFDWILKPNCFVKVLEGNYDNREAKKQPAVKKKNLRNPPIDDDRLKAYQELEDSLFTNFKPRRDL